MHDILLIKHLEIQEKLSAVQGYNIIFTVHFNIFQWNFMPGTLMIV